MGMKNIIHRPHIDIEKACALYSEKDGVPVTYVCTSATTETSATSSDIFFRDTPHPEFGNRYFGLYWHRLHFELPAQLMITNADKIENLDFDMVEELTGKNVMIGLEMPVGPEDAKVLYQQMFACFVAGFDCGRN